MMRHVWMVAACCAIVAVGTGCGHGTVQESPTTHTLAIGGSMFTVEVADTATERANGLQGRDTLAANAGMLFVFDAAGRYQLWMKGTHVALDAVWIAEEQVVDLTYNMQPEPGVPDAALHRYTAATPVTAVVELPAGTIAAQRILVGDRVVFDSP